ncbi:MAG: hypothetical protein AB1750_12230 [Chloroflexota bacterium]
MTAVVMLKFWMVTYW